MVTKVAGGIIGLGAISIVSIAFAKPEWLGINKNKEEIIWTSLAKDHNYSTKKTDDYKDTNFGGKYKYYLVGVAGTDSDSNHENTNKAMWDELFKQWEKDSARNRDSLGKEFKGDIKGGVKTSTEGNEKYLNTVCKEVYKSEASNVDANANGDDKYKESSVWKYCSGLGEKPILVKDGKGEPTYDDGKLGKTKKDKLVSTTDPRNDKFWEIREKEFKGIDGYDPIESGGTTDNFFKTGQDKTIKQLCRDAYKKNAETGSSSTDQAPTETQALKYCSLDKQ